METLCNDALLQRKLFSTLCSHVLWCHLGGWNQLPCSHGHFHQGNLQMLQESDLLFYWLFILKKLIEKMLVMQIKLKSVSWLKQFLCDWHKNWEIEKIFFEYLKLLIWFCKVTHLIDNWVKFWQKYCFTFILLFNKNENIHQHLC